MEGKVLLYIDDDPEDMELFCDAVKVIDPSYVCIGAKNGQEGLELLSRLTPDFIFLDINMPVMDGKETLQSIQVDQRLKDLPVLILSTSSNPKEREVFRRLGARAYLTKPNTFDALCETLRDFLHPVVI